MRPKPPDVFQEKWPIRYVPDLTIFDWVKSTFLNADSPMFNEHHIHLLEAQIGFIWTNEENASKGRRVIGTAEQPVFRCSKWQKGRQEQQIVEWFGEIPDFIITLDANFCIDCSDVDFLMLIEHEMHHCAQALDDYGQPKFNRDTGLPIFGMKGYDCEEFIDIVARYGVGNPDGNLAKLVNASRETPLIDGRTIAQCCGTCIA